MYCILYCIFAFSDSSSKYEIRITSDGKRNQAPPTTNLHEQFNLTIFITFIYGIYSLEDINIINSFIFLYSNCESITYYSILTVKLLCWKLKFSCSKLQMPKILNSKNELKLRVFQKKKKSNTAPQIAILFGQVY